MVLFKKKGVINNYIMKPIIAQYLNVKLNDKIPVYGAKKLNLIVLMVVYCLIT